MTQLWPLLYNHWFQTVFCIVVFLSLRLILVRQVWNRSDIFGDRQRLWSSHIKNFLTSALVFSLLAIWLNELQEFVFSIAAFFVAIVIAFKEFILCLVGSIYHAMSRPFTVGDWIQVDGFTGEVVDRDWVSTTLLDIDVKNGNFNFTGKTLELPNSLFLTHVVLKLHFMRRYVVHRFTLVRPPEVNVCVLRPAILKTAKRACAHFHDVANRYQHLIQKRLGIELPGPDPEVRIGTNDTGNCTVTFTIFCPVDEVVAIEQIITDRFMTAWFAERGKQQGN